MHDNDFFSEDVYRNHRFEFKKNNQNTSSLEYAVRIKFCKI